MPIHFQPSRKAGASWEVQDMDPTAAVTLTLGEPVQRNATDPEQIEAHAGTTTVTGILGVCMGKVTAGTPAIGNRVSVAIASEDQEFLGQLVSAALPVIAPVVATHEGVSYGMVEGADGYWYVDVADTTNVVLRVTKALPDIGCVLFKFLPSAIGF